MWLGIHSWNQWKHSHNFLEIAKTNVFDLSDLVDESKFRMLANASSAHFRARPNLRRCSFLRHWCCIMLLSQYRYRTSQKLTKILFLCGDIWRRSGKTGRNRIHVRSALSFQRRPPRSFVWRSHIISKKGINESESIATRSSRLSAWQTFATIVSSMSLEFHSWCFPDLVGWLAACTLRSASPIGHSSAIGLVAAHAKDPRQ